MYKLVYTKKAREHRFFWHKSGNKSIQDKLQKLIDSLEENPYKGVGKPEKLKHEYQGFWSRRIDRGHRIIYEIVEEEKTIYIHRLKGHYDKLK